MKYIKTFESSQKTFDLETKNLETNNLEGYFKLKNILESNNLNLKKCLYEIRENLIFSGIATNSTNFKLIGTGEFGIALSFLDKVLKITTSKSEFDSIEKLVELDLMGVVKYYLAFQYSNLAIWVIIQDKLKMLPKMQRDIYTLLYYMGANDISNPNFQFKNKSELFEAFVHRVANPKPEDELPPYEVEREELEYYFKRYFDLVEKLNIEGVTTDDLHGENIGIKDDELVHFDVMMV